MEPEKEKLRMEIMSAYGDLLTPLMQSEYTVHMFDLRRM